MMLLLLALLWLITALWGVAHRLKGSDPPPICAGHLCQCTRDRSDTTV